MYSCEELFLRSLECYFDVYFPRCFATWEINTKITLLWALKEAVYIEAPASYPPDGLLANIIYVPN